MAVTNNPLIPDSTKPSSEAYEYEHALEISHPNLTDSNSFFQPNVAVSVGSPSTTFYINATILCLSSGHFKAKLSQKIPDQHSLLELPQFEPAAFNIYLNWLLPGGLYISQPKAKGNGDSDAEREIFWQNILECYFLGNNLDDCDFKDALVDAALLSMLGDDEGVTWFPGRRIRQRLYERTTPGCCMRRLFVHIAASLTNVKELVHDDDPLAFRQELQRELTSGKEEDTYEIGGACAFHEHAPGKTNCYRAKK